MTSYRTITADGAELFYREGGFVMPSTAATS